jgi:hypothetical protein
MLTAASASLGFGSAAVGMLYKSPLNNYRSFMEPKDALPYEKNLINEFESKPQLVKPENYSTEEDLSQQLKRQASFWSQRFLNPGMFNSGSVDRLMFKNQNFIRFIRKDYLFNNGYFGNDREYNELLGNDILDQGTTVTVNLSPLSSIVGRINKEIVIKEGENPSKTYYWIEYKTRNGPVQAEAAQAEPAQSAQSGPTQGPVQASTPNAEPAKPASKSMFSFLGFSGGADENEQAVQAPASTEAVQAQAVQAQAAVPAPTEVVQAQAVQAQAAVPAPTEVVQAETAPVPVPVQAEADKTTPLQLPDDPEHGAESKNKSNYQLLKYPIPKEMFKKKESSLVLKSFFKLNEEQLVPFINQDFFVFLHMFKYNLKKAYAMGRINIVYHNVKAIGLSLKDKKFTTSDEDSSQSVPSKVIYGQVLNLEEKNDPDYYKNYLFAYRKFMTEDAQQVMKTLKYTWDSTSKSISESLKKAKEFLSVSPEQKKEALQKAIQESDKETTQETQVQIPSQGDAIKQGGRTKNYKIRVHKYKTRKMNGGFMNTSFGPLANPRGVVIDKLAKYLYVDNIKKNIPDANIHPELKYVVEEQKLFLGLAIQYFIELRDSQKQATDNKDPKFKSEALKALDQKLDNAGISKESPFEDYKETSENYKKDSNESTTIKTYLESKEYQDKSVSDLINLLVPLAFPPSKQTGGLFGIKSMGIADRATSFANKTGSLAARTVSNASKGLATGISKTRKAISSGISRMGEAAFPNNGKLNKVFDFSHKRMIFDRINNLYQAKDPVSDQKKHRDQLVDFFKEISWCIMMSAHFSCSTILNFATMVQNPLKGIPVLDMLGINTPHCYISGIIMMFLLYQIGPFSLDIIRGIDDIDKKMEENEKLEKQQEKNKKDASDLNVVDKAEEESNKQPPTMPMSSQASSL